MAAFFAGEHLALPTFMNMETLGGHQLRLRNGSEFEQGHVRKSVIPIAFVVMFVCGSL